MAHPMAGAVPHDPDLPLARQYDGIRVRAGLKTNEGSCNACTNGQYTLNDNNMPMVTSVNLRGLNFRLCERCRQLLKEQL